MTGFQYLDEKKLVLSLRTILANLSRWREAAHPPHLLQRRYFLQVPCAETSPDNKDDIDDDDDDNDGDDDGSGSVAMVKL